MPEEHADPESGPKENLWVVVPDKTLESWLEVTDPEGWHHAAVRFDGCIHFDRHYNVPGGDGESDYIHICDLDDYIARLQALKAEALKHFGEQWPDVAD